MIKAAANKPDGGRLIIIGLSRGNLEKFMNGMMDSYIPVDLGSLDPQLENVELMIFSGETEEDMMERFRRGGIQGMSSDTEE